MDKIRAASERPHRHGIPFVIDAACYAENAHFIKLRKGFPTCGGLAGRDLKVMARGLWEGPDKLKTPCESGPHRALLLK